MPLKKGVQLNLLLTQWPFTATEMAGSRKLNVSRTS